MRRTAGKKKLKKEFPCFLLLKLHVFSFLFCLFFPSKKDAAGGDFSLPHDIFSFLEIYLLHPAAL